MCHYCNYCSWRETQYYFPISNNDCSLQPWQSPLPHSLPPPQLFQSSLPTKFSSSPTYPRRLTRWCYPCCLTSKWLNCFYCGTLVWKYQKKLYALPGRDIVIAQYCIMINVHRNALRLYCDTDHYIQVKTFKMQLWCEICMHDCSWTQIQIYINILHRISVRIFYLVLRTLYLQL